MEKKKRGAPPKEIIKDIVFSIKLTPEENIALEKVKDKLHSKSKAATIIRLIYDELAR